MPRKNIDDFDDIPSLIPERDEIRTTTSRHTPTSALDAASSVPVVQAQRKSVFWPIATLIALLLALLASAAGYFLFQQLQLSNQAIAQAEQRITSLEGKLSSSDENMLQSSDAMRAKIKAMSNTMDQHFTQIDKLWAARNALVKTTSVSAGQLSTQGKNIKVLQTEVKAKLAALQEDVKAKLAALQSTVVSAKNNSAKLKNLSDQSLSLSVSLDALQQSVDERQAQMRTFTDSDNQLRSEQAKLAAQLKDLSGWIDSFNGYRKQVNKRLSALEQTAAPTPL